MEKSLIQQDNGRPKVRKTTLQSIINITTREYTLLKKREPQF